MFLSYIALIAALAPCVTAHGYMNTIVVDGKTYTSPRMREEGQWPNSTANPGVIRQIGWDDEFVGIDSSDMICGKGSQLAEDEATAHPGSVVEFTWTGDPDEGHVCALLFFLSLSSVLLYHKLSC